MEIKLYNHQLEALEKLRENKTFALFMEQRTGKTLPMLHHIKELVYKGEIENALIVAPKSAIESWKRAIDNSFEKEDSNLLNRIIKLINYDSVWRKEEYRRAFDLIVLDESHNIKNRKSKRYKFLEEIGRFAKYRYILTGTPIANKRLIDYYSQFNFLQRNILGTYSYFIRKHCILDKYYQPKYYINVDEIYNIIKSKSFTVKKKECLKELPEKLSPEYLKIEDRDVYMREKLIAINKTVNIENTEYIIPTPATTHLILRENASGFIRMKDEFEIQKEEKYKTNKINALEDLILEYGNQKLVVFAYFKHSINNIECLLKKLEINYRILDGEQKDKGIWRDFQDDDSVQIIVCQYNSANSGIDLYKASTMIFYEPQESSTVHEQAKDRIHSLGQKNDCEYIYMCIDGSIEEKIYRTLDNYRDFTDKEYQLYFKEKGYED